MEAKTVQDVIDALRTEYKVSISVPLACQLINKAVNELATLYDTALAPIDLSMEGVEADVPQILPTLGVYKVMADGVSYEHYKADSNSLTFQDSGDYVVTALMIPDNVVSAGDEIPIHMAYHSCIVDYVSQLTDKESKTQKDNNQFYALSQAIHTRLNRTKRRGMRIAARVWR